MGESNPYLGETSRHRVYSHGWSNDRFSSFALAYLTINGSYPGDAVTPRGTSIIIPNQPLLLAVFTVVGYPFIRVFAMWLGELNRLAVTAGLVIFSAYASLMSPLLLLPLSMACGDTGKGYEQRKREERMFARVLEKDSEASKSKKEKYKLLALKAKKASSDEEASCSNSDDEEYAMKARDFKKFFRRRGKFVRQPHDNKKTFRRAKEAKKEKEEHSDKDDDPNKDEICLMAYDSNEVLSDTPYYSSSLNDESLQNEYNKLCKISLRIINKKKHLKTKIEILDNDVSELKERLKQLEKNKAISEECKSCIDLHSEIDSLPSKLAKFENSSYFLQEMIENQRLQKNKKGLGFTEHRASTSEDSEKIGHKSAKKPSVDPARLIPSEKKQTALSISTTEVEYVSPGKACQQALWMKQALVDYNIKLNDIPVLCDNKGSIDLSKNLILHSRTKHIEIRHHFLRDNIQKGNISVENVSSEDNIADILTKHPKHEPFNFLRFGL
nr:copia protein [Tanacetum cinerariifolium]